MVLGATGFLPMLRRWGGAWGLGLSVVLSLALHGGLLVWGPGMLSMRPVPAPPPLRVSLRPSNVGPTPPPVRPERELLPLPGPQPSSATAAPRAREKTAGPEKPRGGAVPGVAPAPGEGTVKSADRTTPTEGATGRIDLDASRAQARSLAVEQARRPGAFAGSGGGDGGGNGSGNGSGNGADRPAMAALAKAIQPPARSFQESEQGGRRVIRFSGNRCFVIPRDIPVWRESGVVPTEWVATNCPH